MQYIPNETPLMLMLMALAFAFFMVYRWAASKNEAIEEVTDTNKKVTLQIELTKATVQSISVIALGVAAALSWHQIAQNNDRALRIESAKALPEIMLDIGTKEHDKRLAALIRLDELAVRYPETYLSVLGYSVKKIFGTCQIDDRNIFMNDFSAELVVKHKLNAECIVSSHATNKAKHADSQ
ncbi:hypothetical protein N9842_01105 [Porticoccaceae bacterium]|nr:hypothetical protein [Porticoccaceae bacterium]